VYGFSLSYIANICIFVILYNMLATCITFCHIRTEFWKPQAIRAARCASWKVTNGAVVFCRPCNLKTWCLPRTRGRGRSKSL
jgi:hypothetical protein